MSGIQRTLIVAGIVALIAGLLWPWLVQLPLGRLPGDIIIDKPGFKVYFPVTSMLAVSAIVSIVLWFFNK